MARSLRTAAVALGVAIALFAAACSDDSSSSGDAPSQAPADAGGDQPSSDGGIGAGGGSPTAVACSLVPAELIAAEYEIEAGPSPVEASPTDECRTVVVSDRGGYVSVSLYTEAEAIALGPDLYDGTVVVDGIGSEAWYVADLELIQARLPDGRVVSIQDIEGETDQATMAAWLESAVGRV